MRELTRKATRETLWGTACLAVALGLWATGHSVPEALNSLVFALVITTGVRATLSK